MDKKLLERIKSDTTFPVQSETWVRSVKPRMICLHHTASAPGTAGDITWWKNDKAPVSTPVLIERDGTIVQIYSSDQWAFALGLNTPNYRQIEELTVQVEIDTWGFLTQKNGKFYSYTGAEVPASEVCTLDIPFKGMRFFHRYTPEQIESTRLLCIHWGQKFGIPLKYVGDADFFSLSQKARNGVPGLYSHNSFRADKTDLHPQKDMIEMLKTL